MEAQKVMRGSVLRTRSECFSLLGWGPGEVGLVVKELYFLLSFHIVLNLQLYCHYVIPPENPKHRFWRFQISKIQTTSFTSPVKGFRFNPASQEIIRSLKSINYFCQHHRKQMEFLVLWWQWWMAHWAFAIRNLHGPRSLFIESKWKSY